MKVGDTTFERISVDPGKMGGVPCIRELRMPVSVIVGLIANGKSEDEILSDYPNLEREDIKEALRFAAAVMNKYETAQSAP